MLCREINILWREINIACREINILCRKCHRSKTEVDIYIMDSGIRGASRPTGVGANLHPELFDPDNKANLNGTSEQGDYRVYELPTSLYASGATGNSNEPQDTGNVGKDGHGTSCAICAAGINAGVANKAKIYSLRISDDSGTIYLSKMREAYDAIYRHNDPEDSAFKGKTLDGNTRARSAVVNVSIGQTNPNPKSPYVDRNERYTGQNYSFTVTAADDSNYTITGTDQDDNVITDVITGVNGNNEINTGTKLIKISKYFE